jgi:hypothetical protein
VRAQLKSRGHYQKPPLPTVETARLCVSRLQRTPAIYLVLLPNLLLSRPHSGLMDISKSVLFDRFTIGSGCIIIWPGDISLHMMCCGQLRCTPTTSPARTSHVYASEERTSRTLRCLRSQFSFTIKSNN